MQSFSLVKYRLRGEGSHSGTREPFQGGGAGARLNPVPAGRCCWWQCPDPECRSTQSRPQPPGVPVAWAQPPATRGARAGADAKAWVPLSLSRVPRRGEGALVSPWEPTAWGESPRMPRKGRCRGLALSCSGSSSLPLVPPPPTLARVEDRGGHWALRGVTGAPGAWGPPVPRGGSGDLPPGRRPGASRWLPPPPQQGRPPDGRAGPSSRGGAGRPLGPTRRASERGQTQGLAPWGCGTLPWQPAGCSPSL